MLRLRFRDRVGVEFRLCSIAQEKRPQSASVSVWPLCKCHSEPIYPSLFIIIFFGGMLDTVVGG